ncbi:TVP38/TMEM64 family protein [Cohnella caldifontis]|uniref:TVP38/TMEM64 family protein n=1 Tax=Cohnella caldifontis TaxID=3027471 RepID=UPI0023EAADA1|nr:VTT domain-containing protein [Cohnella sp. YIM B05605]
MGSGFNEWIENAIELTGLTGATLLAVTIPLAILQGFFGFFPFSTLIFVHISSLGIGGGLLASWLSGTLAAVVVFYVCKFLFAEWFRRKWGHKLERYEKWQASFDRYGFWAIIFLRTLPVMPNNLISFMSAISPIRTSTYIWSSIVGNLSHIWLFGIISSSILFPDMDIRMLVGSYVAFCVVLLAIFAATRFRAARMQSRDKGNPTSM